MSRIVENVVGFDDADRFRDPADAVDAKRSHSEGVVFEERQPDVLKLRPD